MYKVTETKIAKLILIPTNYNQNSPQREYTYFKGNAFGYNNTNYKYVVYNILFLVFLL